MPDTRLRPEHQSSSRYGDPGVIRALARSMRTQGHQIDEEADRLSRKAAAAPWSGAAADAMRGGVALGTASLHRTAELHVRAAVALERHADEVERIAALIDRVEHGVLGRIADARRRIAGLAGAVADPVDHLLARFDPPPSGHKDWLSLAPPIALPGVALAGLAGEVLR